MAIGNADHRLVEIGLLVAERVIHCPVGRAGDALGDVPGAFVERHGRSLSLCTVSVSRLIEAHCRTGHEPTLCSFRGSATSPKSMTERRRTFPLPSIVRR